MKQVTGNTVYIIALSLILSYSSCLVAQDVEGSMVYSLVLASNPALTGAEGIGTIDMVYRDYYPGKGLNLNSFYIGYDTYNDFMHGGVGAYISENNLGSILNEINIGANYSYHLRASREFFINAGFGIALMHRSVNRDKIILPDQIDPFLGPVLPSSEVIEIRNRLLFDMAVGFLFNYRNYNAGISLSHIARPNLTGQAGDDSRIKRRFMVHADASFNSGEDRLEVSPIIYNNVQGHFIYGATGFRLKYNSLGMLILVHYANGSGIYSLQPGFEIETGRVALAYNYLFSPFAGRESIPVYQSNIITVNIRLGNVEKSGVVKAIKLPRL